MIPDVPRALLGLPAFAGFRCAVVRPGQPLVTGRVTGRHAVRDELMATVETDDGHIVVAPVDQVVRVDEGLPTAVGARFTGVTASGGLPRQFVVYPGHYWGEIDPCYVDDEGTRYTVRSARRLGLQAVPA